LKETGSPDIVLLSSPGGNDALEDLPYSNAVLNINSIIDIFQNINPNITIIIEQMAPGHSEFMTSELTFFWESMRNEVLKIADNKSTLTSQIILVDMYSGFDDSLLADDVHYNEDGAKFISNRYFNILKNLLK
jgi:lysophospholipase L1-like esterase